MRLKKLLEYDYYEGAENIKTLYGNFSNDEMKEIIKNCIFDGFCYYNNIYEASLDLSDSIGVDDLLAKILHKKGPRDPDKPCYYEWVKFEDGMIFESPDISKFDRDTMLRIFKKYEVIKVKNKNIVDRIINRHLKNL